MRLARIPRIVKVLGLLQGGREHNVTSLATACGASRRTIFRDLDTIRKAEVPLVYDEERQKYRIPAKYFQAPTALTTDEAVALIILGHELGHESRLPLFAEARSAVVKIENSLPSEIRVNARKLTNGVRIRLNSFSPLADKQSLFRELLAAIRDKHAIRVHYRSFTERETIVTKIYPYQLFFSLHSWFLIARSSLHREPRTFHLGRFVKIENLEEPFRMPRGFRLEQYLGNAWRMIPARGKDQKVVVRFKPLVAANVADVLWHPTQKTRTLSDGCLHFEATVSGLDEIAWWILGYGDQAEVLKPDALRRQVSSRIANAYSIYKRRLRKSR